MLLIWPKFAKAVNALLRVSVKLECFQTISECDQG